ncbi:hypothetical protein AGLY_011319 [Aphis glycines]|uniref:Uncharacterized protein n=1 Tax=Aphis glycines TaxID=307491 RepID=A0A6G0TFB8_APHGL|nr:hypothetical protein AGLY_011319 [Aphis glycines]
MILTIQRHMIALGTALLYIRRRVVHYYSIIFESNDRKSCGKLSVAFFILRYKHKNFYDFSTTKLLANIRGFDIFRKILKYKLTTIKKIDLVENSRFSITFFLFFSIFLKIVGKCLLLTSIMHQEYSLCHRKPPLKFEIEALFRLVMLYTDTKTKKNTHYCKINTFITSFRI